MVSKAKKLLDKLREDRRNWTCDDLTTILEGAGFKYRDSKHRVFKHRRFNQLGSYPIPRSDELAPTYAKDVLRCVEKALRLYREMKEDDQ